MHSSSLSDIKSSTEAKSRDTIAISRGDEQDVALLARELRRSRRLHKKSDGLKVFSFSGEEGAFVDTGDNKAASRAFSLILGRHGEEREENVG